MSSNHSPLATPLNERVELFSREWVSAYRKYVEGRLAEAGSALDGVRFTFGASFSNAPPHLGWPDNTAAWFARIDGRKIEIGEERPSALDRFAESDYNAAHPFAVSVYGEDPDSPLRCDREYRYLMGSAAPRQTGGLPDHPLLESILKDAHDHMARRTVNNPDLEHRIDHLGLRQNAADLADLGYTVLENAFTPEFASELREEALRLYEEQGPDRGFRGAMLLERGRVWEEAVIHPWVVALAEHLLGRGCILGQSDTLKKGPGLDTHPGLHSDYAIWGVEYPFPEHCLEATAVWAIDDFTAENGPTCLIPGSWRKRSQVPPGTTQDGAILIEMPKGSIAFWHGATWHGATVRTAPGTRVSLHNAYLRNYMRPIERYDNIDPAILERNPPVFSTLCALDDPFGKSDYAGADFERYGYASKSGFGRSGPLEPGKQEAS